MDTGRMGKLILLLILLPFLLQAQDVKEVSEFDLLEMRIEHLSEKLDTQYANGVNRMAMAIDVLALFLTVIGLIGFGTITAWVFRIRNRMNKEIAKTKVLNQKYLQNSNELQTTLQRIEELESKNQRVLSSIEGIYMAHIIEQASQKDVRMFDAKQQRRTLSEINFLTDQGQPLTEDMISIKAKSAFYDNDYNTAIELYMQIIDRFSGGAIYYYNIGYIHLETENSVEALKYFEKAVELDATFFDSFINIGAIYKIEGDIEKAISAYAKAAELRPSHIKPWINISSLMLDENELSAAEHALGRAARIDDKDNDYLINQAIFFIKKGQYDDSLKTLQDIDMTTHRRNQILSDDDFAPLLNNPEFKQIIDSK